MRKNITKLKFNKQIQVDFKKCYSQYFIKVFIPQELHKFNNGSVINLYIDKYIIVSKINPNHSQNT